MAGLKRGRAATGAAAGAAATVPSRSSPRVRASCSTAVYADATDSDEASDGEERARAGTAAPPPAPAKRPCRQRPPPGVEPDDGEAGDLVTGVVDLCVGGEVRNGEDGRPTACTCGPEKYAGEPTHLLTGWSAGDQTWEPFGSLSRDVPNFVAPFLVEKATTGAVRRPHLIQLANDIISRVCFETEDYRRGAIPILEGLVGVIAALHGRLLLAPALGEPAPDLLVCMAALVRLITEHGGPRLPARLVELAGGHSLYAAAEASLDELRARKGGGGGGGGGDAPEGGSGSGADGAGGSSEADGSGDPSPRAGPAPGGCSAGGAPPGAASSSDAGRRPYDEIRASTQAAVSARSAGARREGREVAAVRVQPLRTRPPPPRLCRCSRAAGATRGLCRRRVPATVRGCDRRQHVRVRRGRRESRALGLLTPPARSRRARQWHKCTARKPGRCRRGRCRRRRAAAQVHVRRI